MSSEPKPKRALDAAIREVRVAVLAAGFRKLKYQATPPQIAALIAQGLTDIRVIRSIEKLQLPHIKVLIGYRRVRRLLRRRR